MINKLSLLFFIFYKEILLYNLKKNMSRRHWKTLIASIQINSRKRNRGSRGGEHGQGSEMERIQMRGAPAIS
jgi:hypothetical protein